MNRVYILGAGASAGYESGVSGIRPPTARSFFHAVKKLIDRDDLNPEQFRNLWKFVERYYGYRLDDTGSSELDIEELLTMVDIAQEKVNLHREVLDLIVLTLDKVIYGGPCQHHRRLVQSLDGGDAVITFNWDLLVENVLDTPEPNYGVSLFELVKKGESRERTTHSPLLLKLHGSMNWMACPRCGKSFAHIRAGKTAVEYHAGKHVPCACCKAPTEPLIIWPTLLKNYEYPVIKAVWAEAHRVLCRAREIVVVGYSLPATDFKTKWLFMKAAAGRSVELGGLTIVDQDADSLKDKYQRAFLASSNVKTINGGIRDVPCEDSPEG